MIDQPKQVQKLQIVIAQCQTLSSPAYLQARPIVRMLLLNLDDDDVDGDVYGCGGGGCL